MKFLEDIQKSIYKKNGMYMVYILIFLISFLITSEDYQQSLELFRLLYALIGLFAVMAVYFVLKKTRKPKQDNIIKMTLGFFFVLGVATAFTYFKNLS